MPTWLFGSAQTTAALLLWSLQASPELCINPQKNIVLDGCGVATDFRLRKHLVASS